MITKIFEEIDALLAKINFEDIWPGFKPYDYVLFCNDAAFLRGEEIKWEDYKANTAVSYNGKLVATWVLANPHDYDADLLASCLVHEMFHAFQKEQGDTRFSNEFILFAYPRDLDNCQLKMAENFYLIKALTDKSIIDLDQFATLRRARRRIIGDSFFEQELRAETLEGMAEYAGVMALLQLNREKAIIQIDKHTNYLRNPQNLFDIRRMCYFTGCILCLVLKSLNINFKHDLKETRTVFELIILEQNNVEKLFEQNSEEVNKKFSDFRKAHNNKTEIAAEIRGFDPMNTVRLKDEILCRDFVFLNNEFIKGPVLLEMEKDSPNCVLAYIR